jgi:hypothetical protein
MINVFALNQSLIGSPALARAEDNTLRIERDTDSRNIPGLSPKQTDEIQQIVDFISECVPDDFDFVLSLGDSEPRLMLVYEDGLTSGASDSFSFSTSEELYFALPHVDWDSKRGELLKRQQIYDEMLEIADQRPVQIPSVKFLRKSFKEQVKQFHKEARREAAECKTLIMLPPSRDDDGKRLDFKMPSMETLVHCLGDAMTYGGLIVSLCIKGRPLPSREVEEYKRKALRELPPISRAIAEGRWPIDVLEDRGYRHVFGC